MELRTFTMFDAEFYDDAEFTEGGDVKRPGGHNIALTLCEMLRRHGMTVSNPEQHSCYGWAFRVSHSGIKLWFLLQSGKQWLLLSQNRTPILRRLFRSKSLPQHHSVLESLNDLLANDGRFRNIRWFTKEAFEKGKDQTTGDKAP